MYYALDVENWAEFQKSAQSEKISLDEETKVQLRHILENDKEIFAEIYALLRGRNTIRTQWLNFGFPITIELVKKMLSHQSDTEKQ